MYWPNLLPLISVCSQFLPNHILRHRRRLSSVQILTLLPHQIHRRTPPNSPTAEFLPIRSEERSYEVQERKKKVEGELEKARKRNMESKYPTWFDELDGLSEGQLRHFAMGLENKEKSVRDYLELQKRMKFEPVDYYQYGGSTHSLMGLDHQVQVMSQNHHFMNHGVGWFDGAPKTSFVPLKGEVGGFGYPMVEGGMVYDVVNRRVLLKIFH